jgi:hypothetical protein
MSLGTLALSIAVAAFAEGCAGAPVDDKYLDEEDAQIAAVTTIPNCPGARRGGIWRLAATAEALFVADLPSDVTMCRSFLGVDSVTYQVRAGDILLVEVLVSAFPFHSGPGEEHIEDIPEGGRVERSVGGDETLFGPDGRALTYLRRTSGRDGLDNRFYLVIDVGPGLTAEQQALAERVAASVRAR